MLCSFALRDEPASRKPLRVTKVCVACRYYFFLSSFFALSTFYTLLRGSTLIRPYPDSFYSYRSSSFICALLSSCLNEQHRAGFSMLLLIKWPRKNAPGFFNDEILLAAASRRQFSSSLDDEKLWSTKCRTAWSCNIQYCKCKKILLLQKFYYNKNYFIISTNHNFPYFSTYYEGKL